MNTITILFFTGCFNPFAPALDTNADLSNIITEQQSPEEVLQNFRYAYTFKDSLLYSEVLDESFVFEYFDTNQGPAGEFRSWGRDADLSSTGKVFRTFDVIDLVWLNKLFEQIENVIVDGDTVPVKVKQFRRFNLNLFGSDLNFILTGTAIFTFRRDVGGDKWRITRWKDESDL